MSGFAVDLFDSEFSTDNLRDYLGLSDGVIDLDKLTTALKDRRSVFASASSGITEAVIDGGFSNLNLVFNLIGDFDNIVASGLAGSVKGLFISNEPYGDMEVDGMAVDVAALMVGFKTGKTIEDTSPLKAAVGKLVAYYNALPATEKTLVYDYFDKYGLVAIEESTGDSTVSSGSGSGSGVYVPPTDNPVESNPEENVIDETTPESGQVTLGDENVPEANMLFTDLNNVSWAWTAIRQLYIADVIKGKGKGMYDPNGNITRAEFAALLTRMLETGLPTDSDDLEAIFTDVNKDSWYYNEVMAAYEAGFINGVGGYKFQPSDNITREQIATIIARVLADYGLEPLSEEEMSSVLQGFKDTDDVSSWAKAGSGLLTKLGIITGVADPQGSMSFNFKSNASRAEVAVILYRVSAIIDTKVQAAE